MDLKHLLKSGIFSTVLLAAPASFHSTSSGPIAITLHPTEAVVAGTPQLVTTGIPFPRGVLTNDALGRVRVIRGAAEVPTYVTALALWRHPTQPALDQTSVRVLLVQFQHTFATTGVPDIVTLEWESGARTFSLPFFTDPKTAWHLVQDGETGTGGPTFGAAHQVFEPNVYAVLPKQWLAKSGLKSPMDPFGDSIQTARMNPASVPEAYPGYAEADQAQINFFFTYINDDDPLTPLNTSNHVDFVNNYEPWLYDRPMAMYISYLRGGGVRFLREAVRATQFYKNQVYTPADCANGPCVGHFRLRNPNPTGSMSNLYDYNESMALTYWLTGDSTMLPYIVDYTPRALSGVQTLYTPGRSWTERGVGLKLMANTVAYEVAGNPSHRDQMIQIIRDLRAMQTAPYGGLADGGLWHAIVDHDSAEGNTSTPITSPWMSALIADGAARFYLISEDPEAGRLLKGLARHLAGAGSYRTDAAWVSGTHGLTTQSGGAPLRFPFYLATQDGRGYPGFVNLSGDHEHAFDTAAIAAWGAYFAAVSGETDEASASASIAQELYLTFSHVITYWTRPGGPASNLDAFRLAPPRKYAWWFKNASGFSWALGESAKTGGTPAAPTIAITPSGTTILSTGESKQFHATVTGTSSGAVAWSATPSGIGTLSASGKYTAPASFTGTITLALRATSLDVPSLFAEASLVLRNPFSLTLAPSSAAGGTPTTKHKITLFEAAPPEGAIISLSSSDPAAFLPASVAVPSGQTVAIFTINTLPVTASRRLVISAAYQGIEKTAPFTVVPLALSGVSLGTSTLVAGKSLTNATVRLNGNSLPPGAVVALSSSNNVLVPVPSTVSLPPGASSVTFPVTAGYPVAATPVTVTAAWNGLIKTVTVNVNPTSLLSLSLKASSVKGGASVLANTVILTGPAPPGGVLVPLVCSNPTVAQVPATVLVPGGSTSATFTITTSGVAANTVVTITSALGTGSVTRSMTVVP